MVWWPDDNRFAQAFRRSKVINTITIRAADRPRYADDGLISVLGIGPTLLTIELVSFIRYSPLTPVNISHIQISHSVNYSEQSSCDPQHPLDAFASISIVQHLDFSGVRYFYFNSLVSHLAVLINFLA